METKWTPGPWRTNKDFEVEGYPFAVFTVPNGGEFTSVAVCAEYANARLIAAAPEMAELLAELTLDLTVPIMARGKCALLLAKVNNA